MITKPWNDVRAEIIRLYIDDGRTLQDVRGIMKTEHGFEASTRAYRQHFDMWNVSKYNCKKRHRRRASCARNLLPSPPETPAVMPCYFATAREPASPESSASSGQDTQVTSPMSDLSTRPALELPYVASGYASSFYPSSSSPSSSSAEVPLRPRVNTRCLTADGPPSGNWSEYMIPAMFRDSPGASTFNVVADSAHLNRLQRKCLSRHDDFYDEYEWPADRSVGYVLDSSPPEYTWTYSEVNLQPPMQARAYASQANTTTARTPRSSIHSIKEESPIVFKREDD